MLIALLLAGTAHAANSIDDRELVRCAQIAGAETRLRCFEALATRAQANLEAATTVAVSPVGNESSTEPQRSPAKPVQTAAAPADREDRFGLAAQRIETDESKALRSRHVGEFRGWSGDTLFRLENGQLWQQASPGRFFKVVQQPVITIERGALGSYWLSVEGANSRVRVKRIE